MGPEMINIGCFSQTANVPTAEDLQEENFKGCNACFSLLYISLVFSTRDIVSARQSITSCFPYV